MRRTTRFPTLATLLATALGLAGCTGGEEPGTVQKVSFEQDVLPILEQHCGDCHSRDGAGYEKSGLALTGYEDLMQGTQYGPVVKPGDPLSSTLVILVEGRADPTLKMPHGDLPGLDEQEIATLRAWIEQGAEND